MFTKFQNEINWKKMKSSNLPTDKLLKILFLLTSPQNLMIILTSKNITEEVSTNQKTNG